MGIFTCTVRSLAEHEGFWGPPRGPPLFLILRDRRESKATATATACEDQALRSSLVVYAGDVEIMLCSQDFHAGLGIEAVAFPQGDELVDGIPAGGSEVVVPEDCRASRVGKQIGIAERNAVFWERPVLLRASCRAIPYQPGAAAIFFHLLARDLIGELGCLAILNRRHSHGYRYKENCMHHASNQRQKQIHNLC